MPNLEQSSLARREVVHAGLVFWARRCRSPTADLGQERVELLRVLRIVNPQSPNSCQRVRVDGEGRLLRSRIDADHRRFGELQLAQERRARLDDERQAFLSFHLSLGRCVEK